ncbi:MAG: DUF1428 domain-containing protein [Planctomycetes bacterium]|nr:DUF1428 domain-containing protein [Planctomycetota bacterium]
MSYVDGFVLPLPKKNLAAYKKMATLASKVWRDHGALDYCECVGDDLDAKFCTPFPRQMKAKPGETIVIAWIEFKSKAHRNKVNGAVMKDPRLAKMMTNPMPFDCKRMLYGGFKVLVRK